MKKIILSAAVAAAALFGAYTAQQTSSTVALSDLQIENMEALAGGEPYGVQGGYTWGATTQYTKKYTNGIVESGEFLTCDEHSTKGDCNYKDICYLKYTYDGITPDRNWSGWCDNWNKR